MDYVNINDCDELVSVAQDSGYFEVAKYIINIISLKMYSDILVRRRRSDRCANNIRIALS